MGYQVTSEQEKKFDFLMMCLAVLAGYVVTILVHQLGIQELLLVFVIVLLIVPSVLFALSRRWWAKYAFSIAMPVMCIGIWSVAQVWYGGLPWTWPYLSLAARWKNNIGVLAVTAGMLPVLHRLVIPRKVLFIFLVSLLLPVTATVSILRQQAGGGLLIGMYAGWLVYVYLVVPCLLRTRRGWLFAVRALVIMPLLPLTWYIWSGIRTGRYYWLSPNRPRLTFVFNAPHAYAGALLTCLLGTIVLILNSSSHKVKRWWLVLAVILSALLVPVFSRSTFLFLGIFVLSVGVYARWRFRPLLLSMLVVAVLLTMLVVPLYSFNQLDYDQIDRFLSNRLSLFSDTVYTYLANAPFSDWLFGTTFQATYTPVNIRARAEASAQRYQRAHIESTYLQLLLSHGVLGLLAFGIPFLIMYTWLHQALKTCQSSTRTNIVLAIASINGLAAWSLVQDSVPSFGNNLAIFLPILWLPPLLHCTVLRETDRQSGGETTTPVQNFTPM